MKYNLVIFYDLTQNKSFLKKMLYTIESTHIRNTQCNL